MVGGAGLEAERNTSEAGPDCPRPFGLDVEGYLFCALGSLQHLAHLFWERKHLAAQHYHVWRVHLTSLIISLSVGSSRPHATIVIAARRSAAVGSDSPGLGGFDPSPWCSACRSGF